MTINNMIKLLHNIIINNNNYYDSFILLLLFLFQFSDVIEYHMASWLCDQFVVLVFTKSTKY